jgi:quercetin dioxygenase-like cupin family protein/transposase-like protein
MEVIAPRGVEGTDRQAVAGIHQRMTILLHARGETGNVSATCRLFGITRQTYYNWKRRYDELGLDGLRDRRRRPHDDGMHRAQLRRITGPREDDEESASTGVESDPTRISGVDIRSHRDAPTMLHEGTVQLWQHALGDELRRRTNRGTVEAIVEFELSGGHSTPPHRHRSHVFFYVTAGEGHVVVDGESRAVAQGDLVWVPSNSVHHLRPASSSAPLRYLALLICPGS